MPAIVASPANDLTFLTLVPADTSERWRCRLRANDILTPDAHSNNSNNNNYKTSFSFLLDL